jgi:hypothetical protein
MQTVSSCIASTRSFIAFFRTHFQNIFLVWSVSRHFSFCALCSKVNLTSLKERKRMSFVEKPFEPKAILTKRNRSVSSKDSNPILWHDSKVLSGIKRLFERGSREWLVKCRLKCQGSKEKRKWQSDFWSRGVFLLQCEKSEKEDIMIEVHVKKLGWEDMQDKKESTTSTMTVISVSCSTIQFSSAVSSTKSEEKGKMEMESDVSLEHLKKGRRGNNGQRTIREQRRLICKSYPWTTETEPLFTFTSWKSWWSLCKERNQGNPNGVKK